MDELTPGEWAAHGLTLRQNHQRGGTERTVKLAAALVSGQFPIDDLQAFFDGRLRPERGDSAEWIQWCLAGGDAGRVLASNALPTAQPLPTIPRVAPTRAAVVAAEPVGLLSDDLGRINAETQARLLGMMEVAMRSALRRTGLRVKSGVRHDADTFEAIKAADPDRILDLVPALVVAQVLDTGALTGAFDDLATEANALLGSASDAAIAAAAQRLGIDPVDLRRSVDANLAEDREQAVVFLVAAMERLARARATSQGRSDGFDIGGELPVVGTVPPSIATHTLSAAGGAQVDPETSQAVTDDTGSLLGRRGGILLGTGLAAGTILTAVRTSVQAGAATALPTPPPGQQYLVREEYRWLTGSPSQPFPPHQELDGATWSSPTERANVVTRPRDASFPNSVTNGYFPGDHNGCQCRIDYRLVVEIVPAALAAIRVARAHVITVTDVEQRDGYELRSERHDDACEDCEPTELVSAYTSDGAYIGDAETAAFLVEERGIAPELADPDHSVASIGFADAEQKWYGWSHRAIFGFEVGDTVEDGDVTAAALPVGFTAETLDDAKRMAIVFADEVG